MDRMSKDWDEIARAKQADRLQRARMPFPEKIRIMVRIQKRIAPILRARGKKADIWQLDEDTR